MSDRRTSGGAADDRGVHIEPALDPIATPERPATLAEIRASLPQPDASFLRDIVRARDDDRLAG